MTATPTGKRLIGRSINTLEDNIKMDLKEIGINTGNWIRSKDRDYRGALVNVALFLRVS